MARSCKAGRRKRTAKRLIQNEIASISESCGIEYKKVDALTRLIDKKRDSRREGAPRDTVS